MKKFHVFFTILAFTTLFSVSAVAQEKNFFTGKLDVVVLDTPKGDAKSLILIEEKDGKLSGSITDQAGKVTVFDKVEAKPKSITVYFASGSYNVFLDLEKKDDDNLVGTMMDMFDATAKRVK